MRGWGQILSLLTVLLLSPAGGRARETEMVVDRVVAVINDEIITLSDLQEASLPFLRRVAEAISGDGVEARRATERQILEQLILFRLQVQEAKRGNLSVSPAEVDETIEGLKRERRVTTPEAWAAALAGQGVTEAQLRKNIEDQLLVSRILVREVRSKVIVTEEEVAQYYAEHRSLYQTPARVTLRPLLLPLPPEAPPELVAAAETRLTAARRALLAGEDVAAIRERDGGPPPLEGGDEVALLPGEMAREIAEAVSPLAVGDVSAILRTAHGLTVLQVTARQPEGVVPLEQVRASIQETLFRQKLEIRLAEWADALKAKATVDRKEW